MLNLAAIENLKPTDLPAPPKDAIGIIGACTDPNVTSSRLGEIVTHSAVLTAELLRIANSAYFGFRARVTSAAHAVTLLGQRALSNLALCVAIRNALRSSNIPLLDMGEYLEQSLRRAVAARCLSTLAKVNPDEAFTAGMLQDFGLLVMMYLEQDRAADWVHLKRLDPEKRYELELCLFGMTHDRVGELLAETWKLPVMLREVMGRHHAPVMEATDANTARLCKLAHCTDWMAAVFTADDKGATLQRCQQVLKDEFEIESDAVNDLLEKISGALAEAGVAMGMRVGPQLSLDQVLKQANLRLAEDNMSNQELIIQLKQTLAQRDFLAGELDRELELAREVQRCLMPRPSGECRGFHGINSAAGQLSGDFYDYFHTCDGYIRFCIADVSGKGMNAALLMAKVSSLFRCLGKSIADAAALMRMLNREILETSTRGMFVTMIGGRYNPESGQVQLTNAGHLPALFHPVTGPILEFSADAPPLGVLPEAEFKNREVNLGRGALYLYTDGIVEAHRDGGGDLGITGLKDLLKRHRGLTPDQRARRLFEAVRSSEVHDDLTLVVIDPLGETRERD